MNLIKSPPIDGLFFNKNYSLTIKKGGKMGVYPSDDPKIVRFTTNLGIVLELCKTGLCLEDDCTGIFMSRPELPIRIYPELLDFFDVNPLSSEEKKFAFFVGKRLILREIRGDDEVLQIVDKQYNMLELKMKPDIDGIFRRMKLVHIKKKMTNKGHYNAKKGI